MISLFCLLQTQEFKSFTHRIYNNNCPKNPQKKKKKINNQNRKNRINRLNKKKGKKNQSFYQHTLKRRGLEELYS